jgi:multidrug efflux system outer membrane protein
MTPAAPASAPVAEDLQQTAHLGTFPMRSAGVFGRPRSLACGAALTWLLCGCVVGPDYEKPTVETPTEWRSVAASQPIPGAPPLVAEVPVPAPVPIAAGWWRAFDDPVLDRLIAISLSQNKDLRLAAARLREYDARLAQVSAQQQPGVNYLTSASRERRSDEGPMQRLNEFSDKVYNNFKLGIGAAWELDLWGRIRRSNEAAMAEYLAAEEGRRAVTTTLVSSVASTYIGLLSLDRQLQIARDTAQSNADSLSYYEKQLKGGAISRLGIVQVQSAYEESISRIPDIELEIAKTENQLSLLLGLNPGPIARGKLFTELQMPPVPAGIPSDVLAQRPDIRAAEQLLIAANARIGVAKAAFFPSISLTGQYGVSSTDLGKLIQESATFGSFGADITGPIFAGGALKANLHQAEAQREEALVSYQQAIQTAFREVNDALVTRVKSQEKLSIEGRRVVALQEYLRLSKSRYEGGYSSYIEVLDADRTLYSGEISQVEAQRDAYLALVSLYTSMGGGWPAQAGGDTRVVATATTPAEAAVPGSEGSASR